MKITPEDKSGKAAGQPNKQEWYDALKAALPHVRKVNALHDKYVERYNQLARAGDTESEEYQLLESLSELDLDTVVFTLEEAYESELP
jgi:hypothetical protein